MTMFKPSTQTAQNLHVKVLIWGPPGAGKSHFGLSAPRPALVDVENRGKSFASRQTEFQFAHAEIESLDELATAFKEIKSGSLDCESVVIDSGSAIYTALVEEHTSRTSGGAYITDWVTVNRRFLKCLNFVFGVTGKNVIFTAHAATKLIREGRDFRTAGLKFVGDERFRFGFDYIIRIEPKGDPAKTPALFHFEKSSSPNIALGSSIPGLTWSRFREMIGPAKLTTPPTREVSPAPTAGSDEPITRDQCDRITQLQKQLRLGSADLCTLVKRITDGGSPNYRSLTSAQAARCIAALEQAGGANAA